MYKGASIGHGKCAVLNNETLDAHFPLMEQLAISLSCKSSASDWLSLALSRRERETGSRFASVTLNNLTPAEALLLIRHAYPIPATIQSCAQCSNCQFSGIVLVTQVSGDDMLESLVIQFS